MAFYGCYFSFDGRPCTEFGLMMYDFGTSSEVSNTISTDIEIVEDRISRRYTPLHYGTISNKPLEFTMTFGADVNAIDKGEFIDRWDMEAIASWLTSHNGYKWLEITQPDMEMFRYKCFITELKYTEFGKIPWGFTCRVICDSPFAYLYPEVYEYNVSGSSEFTLFNKSSYRGYYKPKVTISLNNGGTFSITNKSDNERVMTFSNVPSSVREISIDTENEIITCEQQINLYQYFNFNFLRLCPGNNHLKLTGKGAMKIACEFPVIIGG